MHFVSEVPVGAGLSSSAALESSLAVALNEVWQLGFDRARLVEAAHLAENDFVGAPTGILDQSASLLSAEGAALFLDCRDASSSPVDLGLDAAGLAVLVIDTKVKHEHVSGGYAARRAACERAARDLGVRALRDVTAAAVARGPRPARRRDLPPRPARRHGGPARARHRRGAPRRGPRRRLAA